MKTDEIMIVLNGVISLEVKIGMMKVPVELARCGDLIGIDHMLNRDKAIDVFYRTMGYTRVLSLSHEDI